MPDLYCQLLDATIAYLRELESRGERFVSVSPGILHDLRLSAPARPPHAAPGPGSRPQQSLASHPPSAPASRAASPVQPALANFSADSQTPEAGLTLQLEGSPPSPNLSPTVLSPEAKAQAFAELRQRVMRCVKCAHLAAARRNVVFGVGDINAQLMFVGEAPGGDEDQQGEPFVGKAGQLLTRIIQTMGLSRQSVYIANILKCRPDTPGQAVGNRKPTTEEMQTCLPYLHEQIDLIRPKVLVALGATAVEGLLGKTAGITRLRGHWQMYRGIPLMPTYHPAFLLRNQALSTKREVWEDMLRVMEKLGMPISDKQRHFFLKANA